MVMAKYGCGLLSHGTIIFQEWKKGLSWFFACSFIASGKKLKVTLGMHMGQTCLRPFRSWDSKICLKLMNWAAFLHAGSDAIIFC